METDDLLKLTAWPEREEDATADALIVHGARLSMGWFAAWVGDALDSGDPS